MMYILIRYIMFFCNLRQIFYFPMCWNLPNPFDSALCHWDIGIETTGNNGGNFCLL